MDGKKTELLSGYKMRYYILCFIVDKTTISSIMGLARNGIRTKENPYENH